MFAPIRIDEKHFLVCMLKPLLDDAVNVEGFSLEPIGFDRKTADGFFTLKVENRRGTFGVVYNDFKLKGGSFGEKNSRRLAAFIAELDSGNLPLIFAVDSMGARIMEGRRVFKDAFGVVPILLRFVKNNLLITCNIGRAFGLGALVFGAGHYRMAIKGKSLANFAGPEVLRLFFGERFDFDAIASAEAQVRRNSLINHLSDSREEMLAKARQLAEMPARKQACHRPAARLAAFPKLSLNVKPEVKLAGILESISDESFEVFGCLSDSVRTFIARRNGYGFGILINPPGCPENMLTSRAIHKYIMALDLFRVMKLPIASFLDTPGADPRENLPENNDVIAGLWTLSQKIIEYPHGKLGVIIGRGYGGANVLGMPRMFGSYRSYVLEGASVGIMHSHIVDQLFANSKSLKDEWDAVKGSQTADCADIVAAGLIDGILNPAAVPGAVDQFLEACCDNRDELSESNTSAAGRKFAQHVDS